MAASFSLPAFALEAGATLGDSSAGGEMRIQLNGKQTPVQQREESSIRIVLDGRPENARIFTSNGYAAYSLEPVKFTPDGQPQAGTLTYSRLSSNQKQRISNVVGQNTAGASDPIQYMAAQAVIWQLAGGEKLGGGEIYDNVVFPNRHVLHEAYLEAVDSADQEAGIPGFLSSDPDRPKKHAMTKTGRFWRAKLQSSGEELDESDFDAPEEFILSAAGDTLTVECRKEPDKDAVVEWYGSDSLGSGIVFSMGSQGGNGILLGSETPYGYMRFTTQEDGEEEIAAVSADGSAAIKLIGNKEAAAGSEMRYDLLPVNRADTALSDFFTELQLPENTKLTHICTGVWTQQVPCKVWIKTNRNTAYRQISEAVSGESEIDGAGLATDGERITAVRLEFASVLPGFQPKKLPSVTVLLSDVLRAGEKLGCTASSGGKLGGTAISAKTTWNTSVIELRS